MPTLREWIIELAVMAAVGVALAALGPFGSFALDSFAARLAYWVPAALVGYAIFRPMALAASAIGARLDFSPLAAMIAAVVIGSVPATLAIAMLGGFRFDAMPAFEDLFQLYLNVALVGLLVATLFLLLGRRPSRSTTAPTNTSASTTPARPVAAPFLARLPPAFRDKLIALEMEDHYVRAHTPPASTLILMRMRDAEAELAAIDGCRVHRSWWVARHAVERAVRDGRNIKLRLSGGIEVPVARDRVAALKAAGWFD